MSTVRSHNRAISILFLCKTDEGYFKQRSFRHVPKKGATGGEAVLVFESNIEMMNTWAVFGKARVR